jgi:hypothetical protein
VYAENLDIESDLDRHSILCTPTSSLYLRVCEAHAASRAVIQVIAHYCTSLLETAISEWKYSRWGATESADPRVLNS